MPFKSDSQRRWMYANQPALARKWQNKMKYYDNGGSVQQQPDFVTVDGQTVILSPQVQVISDQGEDITSTPRGKNLILKAKSGYTEEQEQATEDRQARNRQGFLQLVRFSAEMLPGIGDGIAAYDTVDALIEGDYLTATIIGAALVVGLVPGVGDAIAAPLKALAKKLPVADMQGIARAVKNGDMEFLTGWKSAQTARAAGARPATAKTWFIQNADGTVETFDGTFKEFQDAFGASTGSRKHGSGNLPQGGKWNETGDFKDKVKPVEFVDPYDVKPKAKGDPQVRLPSSLSNEQREAIRAEVDDIVLPHFQKATEDLADWEKVTGLEKEVTKLDLSADIPDNLDDVPTYDEWVHDNEASEKLAAAVSDKAWPQIVQAMEKYRELGAAQYNSIIRYAKQQSRYLFSYKRPQKDFKSKQDPLTGYLEPTPNVPYHYGIEERVAIRKGEQPDLVKGRQYDKKVEVQGRNLHKRLENVTTIEEADEIVDKIVSTSLSSNPWSVRQSLNKQMAEKFPESYEVFPGIHGGTYRKGSDDWKKAKADQERMKAIKAEGKPVVQVNVKRRRRTHRPS